MVVENWSSVLGMLSVKCLVGTGVEMSCEQLVL